MKITFDFETGIELTLKPENVSIAENPGQGLALVTKTNEQVLGLLFFPNISLATPAELKARAAAAKAAASVPAAPLSVPIPATEEQRAVPDPVAITFQQWLKSRIS